MDEKRPADSTPTAPAAPAVPAAPAASAALDGNGLTRGGLLTSGALIGGLLRSEPVFMGLFLSGLLIGGLLRRGLSVEERTLDEVPNGGGVNGYGAELSVPWLRTRRFLSLPMDDVRTDSSRCCRLGFGDSDHAGTADSGPGVPSTTGVR